MKPMKKPTLPGYFSEEEEAARLGIGLACLRRWRRDGMGPLAVKVGRHVVYPHDSDQKWVAEQQAAAERKTRRTTRRREGSAAHTSA
jgi:hypothetical protein